MYPTLLVIGSLEIKSIAVFIVLFILAYIFIFWLVTRRDLKNSTIYDIAFISIFSSLVVSRILGMVVNFNSYLEKGLNILPVSETDSGIAIFNELPWSFFNFFDGNFQYIGIFLGMVIGLLIIYQNSNQKKSVFGLFDKLAKSYAGASIFLLVGMLLGGIAIGQISGSGLTIKYPNEVMRYPVQLFQIGFLVVFLILAVLLALAKFKKEGAVSAFYLVGFGVSEFIFRYFVEGYKPEILGQMDFHQLIAGTIAIVGLLFSLSMFDIRLPNLLGFIPKRTKVLNKAEERKKLQSEIEQPVRSYNSNRFMISFSDRLRQQDQDETNREK